MVLVDRYVNLLIKQYWEKPKAKAEITLAAENWQRNFDFYNAFEPAFDLDNAVGVQLDTLGKIVGINRFVEDAIPKRRFGFEGDLTATTFDDAFTPLPNRAPFRDLFEEKFTPLTLDDPQYRNLIRIKIAINNYAAFMASDDRISIQDIVQLIFEGQAYIVDNLDMTMTLFISADLDIDFLSLIQNLDLLPKPQGVEIIIEPE